ncbi:MAG: OmpA family protein [Candidatus Cloacimonetes bacterium]|nr:OmpA family protein [Candidatus Cloacimonadota bacterium]
MRTKAFLLVLLLIPVALVYAAMETSPGWSYGYEFGIARGDNAGKAENLAPMARGHIQLEVFPFLFTRIGLGFTPLHATKSSPKGYSTSTLMGDYRFIFNPWYDKKYSPFIYGGIGGSLDLSQSDADIIPHIPLGVGLQTQLKPGMNLEVTLGYNLANSDAMDGRIRIGDDDMNTFTGKDHDGFYSLSAGLSFYNPGTKVTKLKPSPVPVAPKPVVQQDPRTMDSDSDGISDYDEINVYGTDPRKADTDGDGLSDYVELMQYRTNPLKIDTDADGINDKDEVITYHTNPAKVDTDGDGLSDFAEIMEHKTNPLLTDTDKGSVGDGEEILAKTNPLDPKDDVLDLKEGATFSLEGIFFETAQANILPESIPVLEKAYTALAANPEVNILITGHTDNIGNDASNMVLSSNRANSVRNWFIEKGIAAERIRAEGRGETQPRASNDTEDGRALNRRIEFEIE